MPKLANINEVISNAMLMRLPAFLGIRDKEFCALLGYAPVWLSRIKKDIDSGKKKPDDAVVTFLDKTISEYVEASSFIDEQSSKNRDILFSVSITALLAVVAYTFNYFFDEVLGEKVVVEVSNLHLYYTIPSPKVIMVKFSLLLVAIIGLGITSLILGRRKK